MRVAARTPMASARRAHRGFTLVELVMVITILGVVSAALAVFMRGPVDAYFATARRAALTDAADLTVRRIARDLRTALPNSIGPAPSNSQCIEFIPTKTGGRYLADDSAQAFKPNMSLSTFQMLGPVGGASNMPPGQATAANDFVVVYNLGITGSDAYNLDNVSRVTGALSSPSATNISIVAKIFPLGSGTRRFHVVPAAEQSVAYVCDTSPTVRKLTRRSAKSFSHICAGGAATTDAVLATNVSSCSFQYGGADLQRNGMVSIALQLTDANETVSLLQQVHVNNTP